MRKDLIKKKSQAVKEKLSKDLHRPSYAMKVAKKLNGLGWFAAVSMYTVGVAALTLHFMGRPKFRVHGPGLAIKELSEEVKVSGLG